VADGQAYQIAVPYTNRDNFSPMNTGPYYFKPATFESQAVNTDLCVYGGVSGAIISAIEGAERGLRVALVTPGWHLGGMTSGGLGMTDIGNKSAIGGKAREFYQRVGNHYRTEIEWRFEPSVAEQVFEDWLQESNIQTFRGQYLDQVIKENNAIKSLLTTSGLQINARIFIDATYEGDLMARAGVSYHVGREANSTHGETMNGQHIRDLHQFEAPVDPYVIPGTPGSGLLPGIDTDNHYQQGTGDHRVQAYNFRMCLTQRDDIRIPFPKPPAYDETQYILLKRYLATGWNDIFRKFDPVRNKKTDTNNHGAFSTDYIGQNHAYANANYEQREKIFQAHVTYQQGLMWHLANDPGIPPSIREQMHTWGLCRDEFPASGGWPHTLYIREARRMIGETIMTEHHCTKAIQAENPIGLAAYGMDSHNCRRLTTNGRATNEGDVQIQIPRPYPIPYQAILPKQAECTNLLVTFCLSATHIAFGSIRMEPVFMVLSQSAAIAATLALEDRTPVQKTNYTALKKELLAHGQILDPGKTQNSGTHAELAEP
jgi:hypothetical protein